MITSELKQPLAANNAVFFSAGETLTVSSFGDSAAEMRAARQTGVVIPVAEWIRIRLSGADRVKFLHNFCTNDVKGMSGGDVVEAFLVDARARVLGHGYIAAFAECLEIWMLPGDVDAISKHLQKYVIVEDVVVEVITPNTLLAVAGPHADGIVAAAFQIPKLKSNSCLESADYSVVCVTWNNQPMVFVAAENEYPATKLWNDIVAKDAIPAGQNTFEELRMAERFPKVGQDLSDSNMAPEADRNSTTINYKKGCYLGQEPIARLDAMGHVNRQLYYGTVEFLQSTEIDPNQKLPVVTSIGVVENQQASALAVVPVKSVIPGSSIDCRTADGQPVKFTITQSSRQNAE